MTLLHWALYSAYGILGIIGAAIVIAVLAVAVLTACDLRRNRYRAAALGDDIITALCRPCHAEPGPCTCAAPCEHPWCARRERTATEQELARLLYCEGGNQ